MRSYMLDTNMVSYLIKGNFPEVRSRALIAAKSGNICISVITEAELRFGVAKKGHPALLAQAVEAFLVQTNRVPWTSRVTEVYAEVRARLEAVGKPLGALDTLIAAHALAEQAILVTRDAAFGLVPGLEVEDWSSNRH